MNHEEDIIRVFEAMRQTRQDDEDFESAVLTAFIAIGEWVSPDGTRLLTYVGGDGSGQEMPRWQTQGYAFNLLHDQIWVSE